MTQSLQEGNFLLGNITVSFGRSAIMTSEPQYLFSAVKLIMDSIFYYLRYEKRHRLAFSFTQELGNKS
jgi:hypothetical protein